MTDLSSEDMADMAGELMAAKVEAAKNQGNMTHLLKLGSFHMEIVPNTDIDVDKLFRETIADLHDRFGEEVLKINMTDIVKAQQNGTMHG
jgi:hypothetical protein|tara:strand:- start:264 stop:533 length:270 start_codon:yes stop_codon:yes gene_type:complete